MANPLKSSDAALALIKQFEGLQSVVYRDFAGLKTIGYGHQIQPGESVPRTLSSVQADALLMQDVKKVSDQVNRLVHAPLTQSMFDALTCFAFNVGLGRFAGSTLLRKLNQAQHEDAANEFLKWNKSTNPKTGNKEPLAGLTARRQAERDLFVREGDPA